MVYSKAYGSITFCLPVLRSGRKISAPTITVDVEDEYKIKAILLDSLHESKKTIRIDRLMLLKQSGLEKT